MSKYQGDGHLEQIDPHRLTLGCVLRMPYSSGAIAPFSDCVVIGIQVSYGGPQRCALGVRKRHFPTLAQALAKVHTGSRLNIETDTVWVKLARPYLYANNPLESMPNWLVGVETYEVLGNRVCETHQVVCLSTGEYAIYNSK